MILESFIVGLSLYTWHPANNNVPGMQLNNNTPGIYIRNDDYTVALFRNSWGRTSVLAALNYKAGPFDFSIGAASGYQYQKVEIPCSAALYRAHGMVAPQTLPSYGCTGTVGSTGAALKPMVSASYAVPIRILGLAPRISLLGNAINFSIEHSFK